MYQILALGKDNLIHCCSVSNKKVSTCEDHVSIKQVNPNFYKLPLVMWCYECSAILERSEGME